MIGLCGGSRGDFFLADSTIRGRAIKLRTPTRRALADSLLNFFSPCRYGGTKIQAINVQFHTACPSSPSFLERCDIFQIIDLLGSKVHPK